MMTDLKKLFESWGRAAKISYSEQQWLLSKWEVVEGVVWSREKIDLMISTIREGLELSPGDSWIDLGCGGGWILKELKADAPRGVGLDFSVPMLERARLFTPDADLVCGEIGRLPFKDNMFSKGLSYFVFLNFMEDSFVEEALRDCYRIIAPGGRLLIGQLPDQEKSSLYDQAKSEYLDYCRREFSLGESHRDTCRAPQKLFDVRRLRDFLRAEGIPFEMRPAFNPFFRPGAEPTIDWRFDLILKKDI